MTELTPIMKQYFDIKSDHKDKLLLFRMGDFYELFYDDAKLASNLLDIVLTSRGNYLGSPIPMCGFPFHSSEIYISKLIKNKMSVAVCEQVSNVKRNGLIERKVVKILTPGTFVNDDYLVGSKNNFICSLYFSDNTYGLSLLDITTGYFFLNVVYSKLELIDELDRIEPIEILVPDNYVDLSLFPSNSCVHVFSNEKFNYSSAINLLNEYLLKEEIDKIDFFKYKNSVISVSCLLDYVLYTQKCKLSNLCYVEICDFNNLLYLDKNSRRDLEIFKNLNGGYENTLLSAIDYTLTAMGKRLLSRWISSPILSRLKINERLLSVSYLKMNQNYLNFTESLNKISDIERVLSKIIFATVKPHELKKLVVSLKAIPVIKNTISDLDCPGIVRKLFSDTKFIFTLIDLIDSAIIDESCSASIESYNFIKRGYNIELDELRDIYCNTGKYVFEFEKKEIESTGISDLKIRNNLNFEFFIEISKKKNFNIPDDYKIIKSMSTKNRYINSRLKNLEKMIFNIKFRLDEKEKEIYFNVLSRIRDFVVLLQKLSRDVSILDVVYSFSKNSSVNNWNEPLLVNESVLEIIEGRHPVIEKLNKNFISNNLFMSFKKKVFIITGANMGGKSTYMRQCALIILLAHTGSHVPASSAKIGFIDKIFTRIGTGDDLVNSVSTFMLEMKEINNIIELSTSNSFILIDEICRGTGHDEGFSLAWAIISHLIDNNNPYMLISTHFYMLSKLKDIYSVVENIYFIIIENDEGLIFLYKYSYGCSYYSYSLDVARLAGFHKNIITKAYEKLKSDFKFDKLDSNPVCLKCVNFNEILSVINKIEPDFMSPKQALDSIYLLKNIIKDK